MLQSFKYIYPLLSNENTEEMISNVLAINYRPEEKRNNQLRSKNPIPTNFLANILSDLNIYDLIEPLERKNRSRQDTNKYWRLTTKGKEIRLILRKMTIGKNVKVVDDKGNQDAENKDTE